MIDITLQQLLEAGCHFGHKSERWHPKASSFIYMEKDGIHIIDLAKTYAGILVACNFITETVANGDEILFVGTKRQAKAILKEEAEKVQAPYMIVRWIGGFLTNWDGIHANIQKINRLAEEQVSGGWKKYPKHEQMKLGHYLSRLKMFYGGVLTLNAPPKALIVIDVKKEIGAVREGQRMTMPVVGLVDTNSDPTGIDYVIPANDDAVVSIAVIIHALAHAYAEGKSRLQKTLDNKQKAEEVKSTSVKTTAVEAEVEKVDAVKSVEPVQKKRGRPKK